jgi:hypothetical protein
LFNAFLILEEISGGSGELTLSYHRTHQLKKNYDDWMVELKTISKVSQKLEVFACEASHITL